MVKLPEWWKAGTVVRITDWVKCDLVPQIEDWGEERDCIGILGNPDPRPTASAEWSALITLNGMEGPGVTAMHPDGWWWVHVDGVEPVEAVGG